MIVFRDANEVPADFGRTVVAIGKFDGVHVGHQAIIERMLEDARAIGAKTVAVTFDRNPLELLRPELSPDNVVALDRKLELLSALHLDATLVLTFDRALASVPAEEFVRRILVDSLHAATVLVGLDFRFGKGGAGDAALLRRLGEQYDFTVDTIDDVAPQDSGRRVSSTWIRELLAAGDVTGAAKVLGRPVTVSGEVVHGLKRGRELGFPTANLSEQIDALAPADGVYAGWMIDHETGIRHPAAISVGTNPTFDDVERRQVEAHVLDRPGIDASGLDVYGHHVTVEFTERLRGMVAFNGMDALIAQMAADVEDARRSLGLANGE